MQISLFLIRRWNVPFQLDTHHMAVDYNAFEGMKVTGEPVSVLSRGEFVIRDKQFVGKLDTAIFKTG